MKFTQFLTEGKIATGKIKLSDKQKAKIKKFAFTKNLKESKQLTESWINYNDMPNNIEYIAEFLRTERYGVDDEDVWSYAREYEKLPSFTGIYIGLVYLSFGSYLENEYGFSYDDYEYDDNFRAGGFYILGDSVDVSSVSELKDFIKEKVREKNGDDDE